MVRALAYGGWMKMEAKGTDGVEGGEAGGQGSINGEDEGRQHVPGVGKQRRHHTGTGKVTAKC